jgi:hypothetical protein
MKQTEEEKKLKAHLYYKKYYSLNKQKCIENMKNYNKTEKGKVSLNKARKKERDNLSDNYIRQNLAVNLYNSGYSLDRKSVSQEHIQVLRQILLTKRELRTCQLTND